MPSTLEAHGKWDLQTLRPLATADGTRRKRLDAEIAKCGFLPRFVSQSSAIGAPTNRTIDAGGVLYELFEQRMRLVNDMVEHAYLQDMAAEVWPGAVIQGEPLTRGDTAVINLPRAPGTLSIVTDLVAGTPRQQSVKVALPSVATIGNARRQLLRKLRPKDSPGILTAQYLRANTLRESSAKLGVDVRGAGFGVQLDASFDSSYKSSTIIASIRQAYYAAAFEPSVAGAAGVFPMSLKADALRSFIGVGNPPLLISRVHYGRLIVITATATSTSEELAAAFKAQWDFAVSGKAALEAHHKKLIDSAEVRVYSIGAVAGGLPDTLTNPLADLDRIYREGLRLSLENPGAPIAFTARHLRGGTLAHVGLVAEYVQPIRAVAGDVDRDLQVWDGAGGGAVDTGVDVAPGDEVAISATGQTWSGVWFTGTHGPEGWPNWQPPDGSPAPELNAHCLIGRFGGGRWFKIGNFWQGTNNTQSTGRLQLNINDNNPYNGDPNQRFSVHVHVTRRSAAAAGIYV